MILWFGSLIIHTYGSSLHAPTHDFGTLIPIAHDWYSSISAPLCNNAQMPHVGGGRGYCCKCDYPQPPVLLRVLFVWSPWGLCYCLLPCLPCRYKSTCPVTKIYGKPRRRETSTVCERLLSQGQILMPFARMLSGKLHCIILQSES